jgi:hypothetical protein
MQVLDLDIRIKSLEEALASSEATLRGEASLAAAKVLLFVFVFNGFFQHNTYITLSLTILICCNYFALLIYSLSRCAV